MATLSEFDFFDMDDGADVPVAPNYEDELGLRELPETLAAERLLKSPELVSDGRILSYRRGRTWAVRVIASSQDKAAALGRRIQKSLVGKRSLTASDPFFHDKRLVVIYDDGWVELPPAEASSEERSAARMTKQRDRDRVMVGKLLAKLISVGGAASIDTRDRAVWKIAESQGFVERTGAGRYRITDEGRQAEATTHKSDNPARLIGIAKRLARGES